MKSHNQLRNDHLSLQRVLSANLRRLIKGRFADTFTTNKIMPAFGC
jgi:hypothetical protein